MDLKRFYDLAAVIFTRAYLGIYKEKLYGIILEPQNEDDLANNAQKVINGLLLKTNDPHLYAVSGTDVVSGNPEAVDAIVGVLYSEGNRLWLKKLNKMEEDRAAAMDLETYSSREEYQSRAVTNIGGVRRSRPSSAPSRSKAGHRGRIALAQAAAVERLFSAGRNRVALARHLAQQASSQPESSSSRHRKEDLTHTYDMKSGRKVLLNQAYFDALARQRKSDAAGHPKNMSDIREAGDRSKRSYEENNLPLVPSRPEWPGQSTGASVDKWVKRMLVSRVGEDVDSALSRPRMYGAYQLMEKLDMLISIEHCFNCAHHSLSLRHDPNEYSKNTDTVLRAVAQLAHGESQKYFDSFTKLTCITRLTISLITTFAESGLCARVGVTRMRARITSKCKQTDADSRIGAFEVQVAFKNAKGDVLTELLHSKLLSRHWPCRSLMEKKLKAFILSSGIAIHPLRDPSTHSDDFGSDGLGPYPMGSVEWEETPLAETFWVFPAFAQAPPIVFASAPTPLEMLRTAESGSDVTVPTPVVRRRKTGGFLNLNCNMANVENVDNKSLNVQWVFDARSVPGIIEKPPVVYQAVPPPSAPAPRRRPLSASATRTAPASNLAQTNTKEPSEKTCSTATDETEDEQALVEEESESFEACPSNRSTAEQLKIRLCENVPKDRENLPLLPYLGSLVMSRGILAAETIACCALLRRAFVSLTVSMHSASHVTTAASVSIDVAAIFKGLDQRKVGTLNSIDIDDLLTLLQNRKCSALVVKLVMLSIGKILLSLCIHYFLYKLMMENLFLFSFSQINICMQIHFLIVVDDLLKPNLNLI